MAHELGVSDRKFRELLPLGLPYTQIQGILWFEPAEVHSWLDKFHRFGRPPGTKRTKGVKVKEL